MRSPRSLEPGTPRRSWSARRAPPSWLAGNVSPELILDSLVLAWPAPSSGRLTRAMTGPPDGRPVRLDATVIGRVQGVGFR